MEDESIKSHSDDGSVSDREDYKKLKNRQKKEKINLGKTISELINKQTKDDPVLAKNKLQINRIKKENKEHIEKIRKIKLKRAQRKIGYRPFLEWNKNKERENKKVATRGIVKLFNSIFQYRKQIKEEQEIEEIKKEKKSTNFLMMHDLKPSDGAKPKRLIKSFEEDKQ